MNRFSVGRIEGLLPLLARSGLWRFIRHGLHSALGRNLASVTGLRFCEVLLGLIGATLLARALGPGGLGKYSLALAVSGVATLLLDCGMPGLATREISVMYSKGQWSKIRGIVVLGLILISAGSLFIATLTLLILSIDDLGVISVDATMIPAAALLIPLASIGNLINGTMLGFRQFLLGLTPMMAVRPGAFVLLLCVAIIAAPGWLTPERALWFYVAAVATSVLVAVCGLLFVVTWNRVVGPVCLKNAWHWLWRGLHFLGLSGTQVVFSHVMILMVGALAGQTAVGLYRIAERGAALGTIGIEIIMYVMRPRFAEFYGLGDLGRLQTFVSHTARFMFASTLSVLILFALFGQFILRELFGPDFEAAYLTLVILTASYCAGNFFGPGVLLLTMCSREKDALGITTSAAVLAFISSLGLIWMYGAVGAALTLVLARLFVDAAGCIVARRKLGIETAVISFNGR